MTSNGEFHDLEIVLLPILAARPGFEATYLIRYTNKGTTTESGQIQFDFESPFMQLVPSNPAISVSGNTLSWNFENLLPFESREQLITFIINSPQDLPAVNVEDQLDFAAHLIPTSVDENVNDNIANLKQIVVGAIDPNDKTCLEGAIIGTELIGEYLHYLIRFENTGTFAAQNIVVRDDIDATKFDVGSLIPLASSHEMTTRISGNRVEFIFQDIMLDFTNENNDGYLAFKIKTASGLQSGDIVSNSAAIYFDYNFPVITEPAITTIQALGISDFDFESQFVLYPNPAKEFFSIQSTRNAQLKSASIYNVLGQLVLAIPSLRAEQPVDISKLQNGSYFVKVISDQGISVTKFTK